MSFPNIPNITPLISVTTEQTIPLLLSSIALEELALAHIVNAEAEKLQLVLGTLPGGTPLSPAVVSISDLLAVDASVQTTLRDVIKKEMLLEFKFENVLDLIASSSTPGGVSINPVTGATCGATLPISGTLVGTLGAPLVGVQVTLAVTGATMGANVVFSTTTPITDVNGNFNVLGTFTGVPGPNSVTITASATVLGVTVSTSQTITFICP
ncbi:carboxypeptidase-like regulatory domain-containing protein [Peribacillus simplex]|uniref:carboxypeptidase-like regulatory domain-containing protein n=1 Tax=Peribacillus simplex TaxID=1478 RepID=UPI003B8E1DAC